LQQPTPPQTDHVSVGRILGPHGTSGQLTARIYSDAPNRFDPGEKLFCNGSLLHILYSNRTRGDQIILQFEDFDSVDAARTLVGQWLTILKETVAQLSEGEYFHFQLLGMRVVTDLDEELGEISEVLETGSNDVYLVEGDSGQILLPAISSVVLEVNLEQNVMLVHLMDGLR
jgi:16S rRNA processing protein RimM